jgi:hypothetical protein
MRDGTASSELWRICKVRRVALVIIRGRNVAISQHEQSAVEFSLFIYSTEYSIILMVLIYLLLEMRIPRSLHSKQPWCDPESTVDHAKTSSLPMIHIRAAKSQRPRACGAGAKYSYRDLRSRNNKCREADLRVASFHGPKEMRSAGGITSAACFR